MRLAIGVADASGQMMGLSYAAALVAELQSAEQVVAGRMRRIAMRGHAALYSDASKLNHRP